jgi:NADH:ubiquinone oxidoreductase subunit 6 (subunit J)
MDLQTFLFWVIASLTGLSAVSVVLTQNIVRAAAWLLFTLAGVAGIFFLLGADFVGATQLIVYVGGILVLVVFGVMLTAQGPFITMRTSAVEWATSGLVGITLFAVLAVSTILATWPTSSGVDELGRNDPAQSMNSLILGEAFLGLRDATPSTNFVGEPVNPSEVPVGKPMPQARESQPAQPPPLIEGKTKRFERTTRVGYLLPFEIVSVHLLVVLIGAAYLARAKRRRGAVS